MYYYLVLVGDMQFHGKEPLTYASERSLQVGSVVRMSLRDRSVLGLVHSAVQKPRFAVKPIAAAAPYPAVPAEHIRLIDWLSSYYPAPFGAIVRQFLPPSTAFPKQAPPESATLPPAVQLPPLTGEQQAALEQVEASGFHLLHGITGSGKTRLYLELASRSLKAGRSSIVLTPEIGLTAQLTAAFEQTFPGSVFVLHSRLTNAERRDIWYTILNLRQPAVVIGPRSALFSPLHSVGFIAIDESHDQAYKNETAPHYRTELVAARLAHLHGAILVSGSATPSLDTYYQAAARQRPILRLSRTALQHTSSAPALQARLVDLRDKTLRSRSQLLSTPLLAAIETALSRQEQTLLFLNRRGTAGAVVCQDCGWRLTCAHCDLPLTYHGDSHTTRCHTCGRLAPLPSNCPECAGSDILLKSYGTKAVVSEVTRLFPSARVQRFDTDVAKHEQIEHALAGLKQGSADIIVGTQMVTKGFDLPRLAVVGVLSADSSLLIPDYTATERTFQLISQVAGRVGRGHRAGTVVVQTYAPNNPMLQAAITQDWDAFYAAELAERHAYRFPPFVFMLKLWCLRATSASAERAAQKLKDQLSAMDAPLTIEGPSPAFHPREQAKYKWQLAVKSPSRAALTRVIATLPSGWHHNIDPVNLL